MGGIFPEWEGFRVGNWVKLVIWLHEFFAQDFAGTDGEWLFARHVVIIMTNAEISTDEKAKAADRSVRATQTRFVIE